MPRHRKVLHVEAREAKFACDRIDGSQRGRGGDVEQHFVRHEAALARRRHAKAATLHELLLLFWLLRGLLLATMPWRRIVVVIDHDDAPVAAIAARDENAPSPGKARAAR